MFKQQTHVAAPSTNDLEAVSSAESDNTKLRNNADFDDSVKRGVDTHYDINSQVSHQQAFNEAIVQLAVLLYQIDGKITLTEQDYFESLSNNLDWRSGISLSAYVNKAIHEARVAIDTQQTREFIFSLGPALNYNPADALDIAMDITAVDGVRSDEELELLSLLSNRVLAKRLPEA